MEGVSVEGVLSDAVSYGGSAHAVARVSLVKTSLGNVSCEYFVNAAGMVGGPGWPVLFKIWYLDTSLYYFV